MSYLHAQLRRLDGADISSRAGTDDNEVGIGGRGIVAEGGDGRVEEDLE